MLELLAEVTSTHMKKLFCSVAALDQELLDGAAGLGFSAITLLGLEQHYRR